MKIDFDKKVAAVKDWLYGEDTKESIGKSYGVSASVMSRWTKDREILAKVADETGNTVEELVKIYSKRSGDSFEQHDFDSRMRAVRDFLFDDLSANKVGKRYQVTETSIYSWSRDQKILVGVAETTGKTIEEIKILQESRTRKQSTKNEKVKVAGEYLSTASSLKKLAIKHGRHIDTIENWVYDPEVLALIAEQTGKSVEELKSLRQRKTGDTPADIRIKAVKDYLLGESGLEDLGVKYYRDRHTISEWINDPEILASVSGETGKSVEELMAIYERKTKPAINLKVKVVKDYLFCYLTQNDIALKYDISTTSVRNWSRNSSVINEISKETGLSTDELKAIIKNKTYVNMISNKISTPDALIQLIETAEDARFVMERFGGDEADVADILAVVYEGRISRNDALRFMEDPSLRKYLGGFQKPSGIVDIFDAGMHLLPYDKNNVIRDIIYRKALEYRADKLGPMPTPEQRQRFLQELESEIAVLQ